MKYNILVIVPFLLAGIASFKSINKEPVAKLETAGNAKETILSFKPKQLPVVLKCHINYVPSKDGYELINGYLAAKQIKVITSNQLLEETQKNLSRQNNQDFEQMPIMSPQEMMNKLMKNMPTVAQDLYVSLLLDKDSATAVHIIVNDAPRKADTKLKLLSLSNNNNLRADSLIFAAIDSCITLKYFK